MEKFVPLLVIQLFSLWPVASQVIDSANNSQGSGSSVTTRASRPEIFTNGFVDVMNYGQMNASARFFKLYLGVPGKWVVPVSLYTGVTSNSFSPISRNNDPLFLGLINPSSGILNMCVEGAHDFFHWNKRLTKLGILYQVGERLLSYNDLQSFQVFTFSNSYANTGINFQTGAWEKNKTDNIGTFWLSSRILAMDTNKYIQSFLVAAETVNIIWGISIGFGIDINKVVNIKSYYYRYLGAAEKSFGLPVYLFSFNYSMRN